jgi:membrane-bound serine protease (ClpP class)
MSSAAVSTAQPAAEKPAGEKAPPPSMQPPATDVPAAEPSVAEPAAPAAEPPGPLYCVDGACEFPWQLPKSANVKVIELRDEVSLGMAAYVERTANKLGEGDVLILDINTFGGRVDAAVVIRDALLGARERKAFTVAYIHPRAISAGALISFATDIIAVAPGATMGAATPVSIGEGGKMQPVEEKVVSYMRKEMRSTAEARGRNGDVAEAMVDSDRSVPGLSAKGKLLTLDGTEALAWGVASFQVDSLDDLLTKLGYGQEGRTATVERVEWSWAEKLAGWLTSSALSGLLMTIGMLALMIGLYSGGAPLPLIIGALCLGTFFFGHHVVNLAGLEELLLMLAGFGLLAFEVFLPGHIVPGVVGILMIITALVMGLVDFDTVPIAVQWKLGWVTSALATVFGSILVTSILSYVVVRYLPDSDFGRKLFLDTAVESRSTDDVAEKLSGVVGLQGVAATDLRPSGKVKVGDRKFDAVARHGFVTKGQAIRVVESRGFSVVVSTVDDGASDAGEEDA